MRRPLVPAAALAATLAACGSTPTVSPEAAAALGERVAAVRQAAERGDPARAADALAAVRAAVADLQTRGELGPQRAREILDAAATVEARLALLPPPPPPPATPREPAQENAEEKDKDEAEPEEEGDKEEEKEQEQEQEGGGPGRGGPGRGRGRGGN